MFRSVVKCAGLACLFLSLGVSLHASAGVADEQHLSHREEFAIHYRFDKIDVDTDYLDNKEAIARIRYCLNNATHVDSITVYSWASPEGGYPHNKWLSEKRGVAAKELLLSLSQNGKLDEGKIKISPLAENWEGLTRMVEEQYFFPNREALLKILYADGIGEETRKWRIKQLDNELTWNYLTRNYMRRLRAATWVCVWTDAFIVAPQEPLRDTLKQGVPELARSVYRPLPKGPEVFFELKTNVLYDAVTALNIGVEVPIGEHFSVGVGYLNPWWAWGPNDRKYAFQIQELGLESRYYISPLDGQRLTGWYGGVYCSGAQYDLQWDTKLCYQGEYWTAGLSAGYVFPVSRGLRLEVGLNVGYLYSDYRHYQPSPDYEHLYRDPYRVGKFTYFGPTKASVTLIVPIYNKRSR